MLKQIAVAVSVAGALALTTPVGAQKVSFAEVLKNMQKCNVDVIKQLMGAGTLVGTPVVDPGTLVNPDGASIIVAGGGTDCVEGEHALINSGGTVTDADHQGNTALHMAAASSTLAMVQLLVDKGADINAKNSKGETPLALAQTNNYKGKTEQKDKIIAYLTKKGAK